MKVLQSIPAKITTATGIRNWLAVEFGSVDWYTRKQQWKQIKMVGLDPMPYFDAYNIAYANHLAAAGPDSATDALDIVMEGLDQKFYSECIRGIRAARRVRREVDDNFISNARKLLWSTMLIRQSQKRNIFLLATHCIGLLATDHMYQR